MERKFPIYIAVDDISDAVLFDFVNSKAQSGTLISFVHSLLRGYILNPEVRQAQDTFQSVMGDFSSIDQDLNRLQQGNAMQGTLSGMLQDFTNNQAQSMGAPGFGASPVTPGGTQVQPNVGVPNPQAFLQGMVNSAVQSCIQGMVMQCLTQSAGVQMQQPVQVSPPPAALPVGSVQVPMGASSPVVTPVAEPVAPVMAPTLVPEPVDDTTVPVAVPEKAAVPSAKPNGGAPASFNKLLGSM